MFRLALLASLLVALGACSGPQGGPAMRCVGKCDSSGSSALDGRADPIADWLRAHQLAADLTVDGDFKQILFDVAQARGCSADSVHTFIVSDDVLHRGRSFPRLVSTTCTDDDSRAPGFFISLPLALASNPDDLDPRSIEMFAWDEPAQSYRFYATHGIGGTKLAVEVEPARCASCHAGPRDLDSSHMPMTAIMNELTAPWVHWDAQPGFVSDSFDVPAATQAAPSYSTLGLGLLAPASRLEQLVRVSNAKVNRARLLARRAGGPPDLGVVMALLRPLFCDEQVNYVTEAGGQLAAAAALNGGIAAQYNALAKVGPWGWLNPPQALLLAPAPDRVFMMPVRAEEALDLENRMVALGLLTPMQVLRVQALDWQHPLFSDFRCSLWTGAAPRFATSPPALDATLTNGAALAPVLELLLSTSGVALAPASGQLIALGDATPANVTALATAVQDQSIASADCAASPFCLADTDRFGAMLDGFASSFSRPDGRTRLAAERHRRICQVQKPVTTATGTAPRFENAPSLPGDDQCPAP